MSDTASISMFWEAAIDGNLLDLRRYVAAQINVNAKDRFGKTALHKAAISASDRSVSFLLKLPNIDLSARDNRGSTPSELAARFGNDKIVTAIETEIRRRKESVSELQRKALPSHTLR